MSTEQLNVTALDLEKILGTHPPEIGQARVTGDFTDAVERVVGTSMSAAFSLGRPLDSDDSLLLPHAHVTFRGIRYPAGETAEPPVETYMSRLLSLENAALLVTELAGDFNGLSRDLLRFHQSSLKPEKVRILHARYLLAHAARQSLMSVARLNLLLESYPEEEEEESEGKASGGAKARPKTLKKTQPKGLKRPASSPVKKKASSPQRRRRG